MPSIFAQATEFRAALLRRDKSAATDLVRAYGEAYRRIQFSLAEITKEIAAARGRGEDITPAWLMGRDRLASLLRQVEGEMMKFSSFAEMTITGAQREVVALAEAHALTWTGLDASAAVTGTFSRLPTGAIEELAGFLSQGSPLRAVLDELGPQASLKIRQSLITGVATGQTPARIAAEVRGALGGNLTRALTISRTSVTQAYRTATVRTYRENSDIFSGWMWVSAKSSRSCLNCLARDGSVWPLSKFMPVHPACRCFLVGILRGREMPARQSAEEWFESQTEEAQREQMGPGAFEMFRRGEVKLMDFAGLKRDKRFGTVSYQRSLKEIREMKRKAA